MNTNKIYNNPKRIAAITAYLLGVKEKSLEYFEEGALFKSLESNKQATIIRLCNDLRSRLMINYNKIEKQLKSHLMGVYYQSNYSELFDKLNDLGVNIIKANVKTLDYLLKLNDIIANRIGEVRNLYPEWIKWEYIKRLFIMPDGKDRNAVLRESFKFSLWRKNYPYAKYINWYPKSPMDKGNILHTDGKFLETVYEINGDIFDDENKIKDANNLVKDGIYEFIGKSKSIEIVVDCENADVYKFASTLTQLNDEELNKIKRITLYDDEHTTNAWKYFNLITDIPITHHLIERIKDNKSLVDMKMATGITASHYNEKIESFILVSSDSDFWGVISSLPTAKFLVLLEREKFSDNLKKKYKEESILFCFLDDFCDGNIQNFKNTVLREELRSYMNEKMMINVNDLVYEIFSSVRLEAKETEKENFLKYVVKKMTLYIDKDGYLKIRV